jgi:Zn finger protein HypA/HybF involved in hydrogenase expression
MNHNIINTEPAVVRCADCDCGWTSRIFERFEPIKLLDRCPDCGYNDFEIVPLKEFDLMVTGGLDHDV